MYTMRYYMYLYRYQTRYIVHTCSTQLYDDVCILYLYCMQHRREEAGSTLYVRTSGTRIYR